MCRVAKMKDSGVKWIGEIPEKWEMYRVKDGFIQKKSKAFQEEPVVLSLARSGIKIRDISSNDGQLAASYFEYNPVDIDDVLLNPMDLISGANCNISKVEGVISPAYVNLRYKDGFNPNYYNYYFKIQYWLMAFFAHGKGVSFENRWTLNIETLMKYPITVPLSKEQELIALFLDEKCSEIDSLYAEIEEQIKVLEEYKKSVITEVVTKGLNSDVEMKDSGIEWIGEIPKEWKVDKFKYHLCREELKNPGEKIVLSLYRELGIVPKDSRDDNHNITSEDTSKYKYVQRGSFVVNKMKAWQGSVAVSDFEGVVSPAYFVYEFTDSFYNKRYFHYLLRACYKDEFMRLSGGIRVGQWDLSSDALDNTLVLIPDKREQCQIANYLDTKCVQIDSAIADKQHQLDILEQYKKSLIYEYVTGKKEVPA